MAGVAGPGATDVLSASDSFTVAMLTCANVAAMPSGCPLPALAMSRWRLATKRVKHVDQLAYPG